MDKRVMSGAGGHLKEIKEGDVKQADQCSVVRLPTGEMLVSGSPPEFVQEIKDKLGVE